MENFIINHENSDDNSSENDSDNDSNYTPTYLNRDTNSNNALPTSIDIDDVQLSQSQLDEDSVHETQLSNISPRVTIPSITTISESALPLETIIANEECKRTTRSHRK